MVEHGRTTLSVKKRWVDTVKRIANKGQSVSWYHHIAGWSLPWQQDHDRSFGILKGEGTDGTVLVAKANRGLALTVEFSKEIPATRRVTRAPCPTRNGVGPLEDVPQGIPLPYPVIP